MVDKKVALEVAIAEFTENDALIVKTQSIPATTVSKALILSQGSFDETTNAMLVAGDFADPDAVALNTTHRGLSNNPHSVTSTQTGGIPGLGVNEGTGVSSPGTVASMAQGYQATASGNMGSFSQGQYAEASGNFGSFAQGYKATATGLAGSFSQGYYATTTGSSGCFAQGSVVSSTGVHGSFVQGTFSDATGYNGSFSQGDNTFATGNNGSFAQGYNVTATGDDGSFAQGGSTTASTVASGNNGSFAQGFNAAATGGNGCFAQGTTISASGSIGCFAQGFATTADGYNGCFAQGNNVTANGDAGCFAQGAYAAASGSNGCFAQGTNSTATADTSWQIGTGTNTTANSMQIGDFQIGAGADITGANEVVIRSSLIDFESVADTNMFTIPTGFMFNTNDLEVVTKTGTPGSAATVRFGVSTDRDKFQTAVQTTSDGPNERHIFDSPEPGEDAAVILSAGVTVASNAAHTGYFILRGYLLKI